MAAIHADLNAVAKQGHDTMARHNQFSVGIVGLRELAYVLCIPSPVKLRRGNSSLVSKICILAWDCALTLRRQAWSTPSSRAIISGLQENCCDWISRMDFYEPSFFR